MSIKKLGNLEQGESYTEGKDRMVTPTSHQLSLTTDNIANKTLLITFN